MAAISGPGANAAGSCHATEKLRRVMVKLEHPEPRAAASFTVLQWNILADGLAQHGDFIRVHPEVLEWQYRRPLIIQEALEANADVLCFQELNHFEELSQALAAHGYEGMFMPKGRSPACKYDSPADGVAIFWRKARLQPVASPAGFYYRDAAGQESPQCCLHVLLREVEQSQPLGQQQQQQPLQQGSHAPSPSPSSSPPQPGRVVSPRQVLVATTHLKAKEGAGLDAVRTSQMQQLLQRLRTCLEQAGSSEPGVACAVHDGGGGTAPNPAPAPAQQPELQCIPVVIAGDFNSVPASGPCQLLSAHPWNFQSIWDAPVAAAQASSGAQGLTERSSVPARTHTTQSQQHAVASGSNGAPTHPELAAHASGAGTAPACCQQQHNSDSNGAGQSNHNSSQHVHAGSSSVDALTTLQASSLSSGEFSSSEFSTWKFRSGGESKRVIDHMYYSGGSGLLPASRWRMLSEEEIGGTGLPCARYPSDHIALCCHFLWE